MLLNFVDLLITAHVEFLLQYRQVDVRLEEDWIGLFKGKPTRSSKSSKMMNQQFLTMCHRAGTSKYKKKFNIFPSC